MPINIAPPKATAGGGFVFENDVAALYLCSILAGRLPFSPSFGPILKVSFQTAAEGWLLDDILLTTGDGGAHRIALSVKDRPVLGSTALLSDVVDKCWRQLLHDGSDAFCEGDDLLGLAIGEQNQHLAVELRKLIELAREKPPDELANLLGTAGVVSEEKRKLWTWFKCPEVLAAKYGVSENDTGKLLAHFRLIQFDFGGSPSRSETEALTVCVDLLENPSPEQAAGLWDTLRSIANESRPRSGSHTLVTLLRELRPRYRLRQYPFHQKDWRQLSIHSKTTTEGIEDAIGGRVHIQRDADVREINDKLRESRLVVLLGSSGSGKSVLAKAWASNSDDNALIWLPARLLETATLSQVEGSLKLDHSFADLLPAVNGPVATLVVDGVDRLSSDEALANLRTLLKCLDLQDEKSPWRVLLTSTQDDWFRIERGLLTQGLPSRWIPIIVQDVDDAALEPVWKEFPSLSRIGMEPRLKALRGNLKVLDLFASGLVSSTTFAMENWIGESDIVAWFWEGIINRPPDGFKRTVFLQRLAESQADNMRNETPLSTFSVSDLDPLDGLLRDRLCVVEEERLRFAHDLYGDWARQRVLLGHDSDLRLFLENRAISPLWHAAIRLLGLHLLERNDSPDRWREAFEEFGNTEGSAKTVQDLLLDAAYVSPNSQTLLDKLWPLLEAEKGSLLSRMLTRFAFIGTTPNPMAVRMAASFSEELATLVATQGRIPYWPYWPPMLQFLASRAGAVTGLAPRQVAQICDTWLRWAPEGSPLRTEAAEMAVSLAERMRSQKSDIWS